MILVINIDANNTQEFASSSAAEEYADNYCLRNPAYTWSEDRDGDIVIALDDE